MAKTPSSLKWLINKRARIYNDIKKLESSDIDVEIAKERVLFASKELDHAKKDLAFKKAVKPKILAELKKDLHAIDIALSLHEIQIDSSIIPPINSHTSKRLLKHGEITRLVYQCLKHAGSAGLYTSQIVAYIDMIKDMNLEGKARVEFQVSVRTRLKTLCCGKKVERLHERTSNEQGRWRLPQK